MRPEFSGIGSPQGNRMNLGSRFQSNGSAMELESAFALLLSTLSLVVTVPVIIAISC